MASALLSPRIVKTPLLLASPNSRNWPFEIPHCVSKAPAVKAVPAWFVTTFARVTPLEPMSWYEMPVEFVKLSAICAWPAEFTRNTVAWASRIVAPVVASVRKFLLAHSAPAVIAVSMPRTVRTFAACVCTSKRPRFSRRVAPPSWLIRTISPAENVAAPVVPTVALLVPDTPAVNPAPATVSAVVVETTYT
jgi:hypothetical protein